jgi:hypothetical protein
MTELLFQILLVNIASVTYTHTFPIVRMMELPPVIVDCKPNIPKLKGILHNKHECFVDTSLLYDIWCNDCPVKIIKLVDVIDTIANQSILHNFNGILHGRPS